MALDLFKVSHWAIVVFEICVEDDLVDCLLERFVEE